MPDPIGIVQDWAGNLLKSDPDLLTIISGVYSGQADENAEWPYIVLGEWASRNNLTLDGILQVAHVDFKVIAVSRGDQSDLVIEKAQERVFALLHCQSGEGNQGTVYGCTNESSDRDAYTISDVIYRVQADHYHAVVR